MSFFEIVPIEVIHIILQQLGLVDFFKCRLISKKWRCIVDSLLETESVWQKLCHNQLPDHGRSMLNKSTLNWRNICRNVGLWRNIKKAEHRIVPLPIREKLKGFHVYKDFMIGITDTKVIYYEIPAFEMVKEFNFKCKDFNENDFLFLILDENYFITLLGKSNKEDELNANTMTKYVSEELIFYYALQDNYCVIMDKNCVLTECKWNKDHFQSTFLARWYGPPEAVWDLVIVDNEPFVILSPSDILKVNRETKQLYLVEAVLAPLELGSEEDLIENISRFCTIKKQSFATRPQPSTASIELFESGQACGGVDVNSRINTELTEHVFPNIAYISGKMKNLYLRHGEMLIIGFTDRISIYAMDEVRNGKFVPEYNIRLKCLRSESVGINWKIDVHETEDGHYLFLKFSYDSFIVIDIKYPSKINKMLPGDDILRK